MITTDNGIEHPPSHQYFYYDYENRLVKYVPDETNPTYSEFVYDPLGRRIKSIEKWFNGTEISHKQYVYDGLNVLATLCGDGSVDTSYVHGPGIDNPMSLRIGTNDYFYHKNHQNSITYVSDTTGTAVDTYRYDAFGFPVEGRTPDKDFTYTGREYHTNSGLYYYRNRFYDPENGRFISQDPIGVLGGINLYTYVLNDPVNLTDPYGRNPLAVIAVAWGSLEVALSAYDVYDTGKTLLDPCATEGEKAVSIGFFGLGLVGPGGGYGVADDAFELTAKQLKKLKKFKRGAKGANVKIHSLPNGGAAFVGDVPARNIPGSFARYEQQVNAAGKTTTFSKTTYASDGTIVHVKQTVKPPHGDDIKRTFR